MVKGRVTPPKCLFHVATQTEKDQCTLIEQPAHDLVISSKILSIIGQKKELPESMK